MKLTVYYDDQFWVGVVEVAEEGQLKAGRYLFGAEPSDAEILEFVEKKVTAIINSLSQSCNAVTHSKKEINLKRRLRQAAKELRNKGVSSRAQEALRLEYEARKKERKTFSRQQREALEQRKREIKRQKAKAKHRGR